MDDDVQVIVCSDVVKTDESREIRLSGKGVGWLGWQQRKFRQSCWLIARVEDVDDVL